MIREDELYPSIHLIVSYFVWIASPFLVTTPMCVVAVYRYHAIIGWEAGLTLGALWGVSIIVSGLLALWLRSRLRTEITNNGITIYSIRGDPFSICWDDIASVQSSRLKSPVGYRDVFLIDSIKGTVRIIDWYKTRELANFIEERTNVQVKRLFW